MKNCIARRLSTAQDRGSGAADGRYPVPGQTTVYDDTQTIDLETVPLNGGLLVKTLVLSIDPFLRGRMTAPGPKAYIPPFTIGKPIEGRGVGVVIRSELEGVGPGQHVQGLLSHQEFNVLPGLTAMMRVIPKVPDLAWSTSLGAAGVPGAIRTLPSTTKRSDTHEVLAKEGPINIYWDNVGGETLETALVNAAQFARFIECGMVSGYNTDGPPLKAWSSFRHVELLLRHRNSIYIHGFRVTSLMPKYLEECTTTIPSMVISGQIKYKEDISHGLETVGDALLAVQNGANRGKFVVVVAEE
ncbi:hypothetical protein C8J57DRAFT_1505610 [Mycena rebaudengoi]|nr:hypothetical protein C8J57DRAFT_1505610 [Mycena rebaudengoi]